MLLGSLGFGNHLYACVFSCFIYLFIIFFACMGLGWCHSVATVFSHLVAACISICISTSMSDDMTKVCFKYHIEVRKTKSERNILTSMHHPQCIQFKAGMMCLGDVGLEKNLTSLPRKIKVCPFSWFSFCFNNKYFLSVGEGWSA